MDKYVLLREKSFQERKKKFYQFNNMGGHSIFYFPLWFPFSALEFSLWRSLTSLAKFLPNFWDYGELVCYFDFFFSEFIIAVQKSDWFWYVGLISCYSAVNVYQILIRVFRCSFWNLFSVVPYILQIGLIWLLPFLFASVFLPYWSN
jgi:hypothetical protein